ncbi:MAG: GH3 auxin-responsive promoter family protein [Candidatus Methanosuratincola petrocarbonis]|nr:GH3 auxin-responsive promoter family protein [Candidatus Methanosuratincola sp.]
MEGFAGLQMVVEPWYRALEDPEGAQTQLLTRLTDLYSRTGYGQAYCTGTISGVDEYRHRFPVVDYQGLKPWLDRVKNKGHQELLGEPVIRWVMTRGTTGKPKLIPATRTHLEQVRMVGARGLVNHALRTGDQELLNGGVLNLNFPSTVDSEETGGGRIEYGYSSGTYAKYNPRLGSVGLVPSQEEIDGLGSGISRQDWEKRFELVYERAKGKDVRSVMGVTNVITAFGRYLKKRHGLAPKGVWRLKAAFCTSLPKIHTYHAPKIKALYGAVSVVEMYTATEGIFAQQLDNNPYVVPNYDAYFLEVMKGKEVKMLHELKRGEWGRLVVSSCLFPRYDIGDYIECAGKNYYRVFGRANKKVLLEHILFNIFTGRIIRA